MSKEKMVILDALTLGQASLAPIDEIGELTSYPLSPPETVVERLSGTSIAISNKINFQEEVLKELPDLKLIQITATGTNNVDLDTARALGVTVCNVPAYSTESVAQLTLTFLLNFATSLSSWVKEAPAWADSKIFTRYTYPVWELRGKTLGIIGGGAIGGRVATLAQACGMRVIFWARPGVAYNDGRERFSLDTLLPQCDAVTLHAPLTEETTQMVNKKTINLMQKGSFLINTGRGGLIDEAALIEALRSGHLGGAALDVLSVEPPPSTHPLLDPTVPNLFVTPHIGFTSKEALDTMVKIMAGNIRGFLEGAPRNVVT